MVESASTVAPRIEVKELGHVVLYVRDLAVSSAFYEGVLGFLRLVPEGLAMPAAAFVTSSHRTHHELLLIEVGPEAAPVPDGRRVGLYHIGIRIGDSDEQLRAAMARCREAGVRIMGLSDHHVSHSLYVLDPDGNELELYIDVPGIDWRADPSVVMAPTRPLRL